MTSTQKGVNNGGLQYRIVRRVMVVVVFFLLSFSFGDGLASRVVMWLGDIFGRIEIEWGEKSEPKMQKCAPQQQTNATLGGDTTMTKILQSSMPRPQETMETDERQIMEEREKRQCIRYQGLVGWIQVSTEAG